MTAATLTGYRETHRELLSGHWVPGELLAAPGGARPALAEPGTVDPAARPDQRLYIVPGAGFVRYREINWIHRRARVEIGLRDADPGLALAVLRQARTAGHELLGLSRLYGWVTPAASLPADLLAQAGFACEATVPGAIWTGGRLAARQVWAAVIGRDQVKAVPPVIAGAPPRLVRLSPAGPHLAAPGAIPLQAKAQLARLSPGEAAARLRVTPGGGRGFLGLDPVTQNDAALVAGLAARQAMVWSFGPALVGACPNPVSPRQAWVTTTTADPAALDAATRMLRVYQRTASLVAAVTAGEPAAEAVREGGFTAVGTLRGHDYRSGAYHDIDLHYLSLE